MLTVKVMSRALSVCCALMLGAGCFSIGADAKVIEPEIVKTEKWTTSYYIDDDMDTLYPYIQCEADIYNDGTIKLYMWNTHEWDGFATVSHKISLLQTCLYSSDSPQYSAKYAVPVSTHYDDSTVQYVADGDISSIDLSYFPSEYKYSYMTYKRYSFTGRYLSKLEEKQMSIPNITIRASTEKTGFMGYDRLYISEYLPQMVTEKPEGIYLQFIPQVDPTGTYNFRIFGHDITITPELLSGSVVAEPELTEQEKYIKQLETENAALKKQLAAIDSDSDGLLTAADAQMILNYYVAYLAKRVTGTAGDYPQFADTFSRNET